ncbi:response regulator transcription factor [Lacrimispora algidixylanolytica]|uniref:Stage 0 sporulation protein A homolog n=1 Tax=Lacrimispora algidixylanolytica TaxID=94868 RepID=A0A419SSG5_9FIRM|nr:response regulator transcription factor [Lacrimispora algidixylanolytica]RKD28191.1 DNA-binding response regulator [Lacrimispora algidixylanolytica]
MEQIYVIEDDDNIRDLIKIALEGFGYEVVAFEMAEDCLKQIESDKPALAVFDLMLPGMDGLSAIRKIRKIDSLKDLPVLVLTAKDREFDKVAGLDGGADDYMTKPFGVMELAARIRSLLRRSTRSNVADDELELYCMSLNKKTREVYCEGTKVELTLKEFELLQYLMENHNKVVTRDELLNHIWGYDYDGETRTLDMHIRTLRQKLGEKGSACIKTVRGVGYRFIRTQE